MRRRPAARLRRAWTWISGVGVNALYPAQARAAMGANHFYVLASLASVPWAVVLFAAGSDPTFRAGWGHIAMILTWLACIALNRFRLHTYAAFLALTAPLIQFVHLSALFSRDSGFHLLLLAIGAIAFVIFQPSQWGWRVFFTCVAAIALVWVYADSLFTLPVPAVSDTWVMRAAAANVVLGSALVFLLASFNSRYLVRERSRNERLLTEARVAAQTDSLTEVANRRGIAGVMAKTVRQSDYALALADLDRFKRINDRLGHGAGDVVLSNVARTLVDAVGPRGTVARWGGEEFLVVIPHVTFERAVEIMEKARLVIEQEFGADGVLEHVTMSVGVAHAPRHTNKEEVLRVADSCLYEAKASGRNVVVGARVTLGGPE